MPACDAFEMWIEMRSSHALRAADGVLLERHLEGCAACRHYQALVRQTETTMMASTLDLTSLDANISALRKGARRRRWGALPVLAALAVGLCLATGKPVPVLLSVGAAGGLVFAAFHLRAAWEARQIRKLGQSEEQFLGFYRKLLRSQQRRLRTVTVLVPLCALQAVVQFSTGHWPRSMRHGSALAVVLGVLVVSFAFLLLRCRRELPRIYAELARLDGH